MDQSSKASTPDHLLVRNPHADSIQKLIALSLIPEASQCINCLKNKFIGVDLGNVPDPIREEHDGPVTIQRLKHQIQKQFRKRFHIDYLQLALTNIALLFILSFFVEVVKNMLFQEFLNVAQIFLRKSIKMRYQGLH